MSAPDGPALRELTTAPTVMRADLPAEPAEGSVVLDREQVAWQRRSGKLGGVWVQAGTTLPLIVITPPLGVLPWARLLTEHGPLTLVYRSTTDRR